MHRDQGYISANWLPLSAFLHLGFSPQYTKGQVILAGLAGHTPKRIIPKNIPPLSTVRTFIAERGKLGPSHPSRHPIGKFISTAHPFLMHLSETRRCIYRLSDCPPPEPHKTPQINLHCAATPLGAYFSMWSKTFQTVLPSVSALCIRVSNDVLAGPVRLLCFKKSTIYTLRVQP